jgi:hypothetical protein
VGQAIVLRGLPKGRRQNTIVCPTRLCVGQAIVLRGPPKGRRQNTIVCPTRLCGVQRNGDLEVRAFMAVDMGLRPVEQHENGAPIFMIYGCGRQAISGSSALIRG